MTRPRLLRAIAATSVLAAALGGAAACLDLTPIIYEEAPKPNASAAPSEGGTVDAAVDGGVADADAEVDVDMRPPCIRCITSPDDASMPGCADEISACTGNAECAATYACALANGCFEQPSFRDIVNCGIPCAEDAGITTSSDPAITLIYDIATCAQNNCNQPCHIGDGGL